MLTPEEKWELARKPEQPREKPGTWPQVCVQRAFVEGAQWWQFHGHGSTMFPSERDEVEAEAVRRYGDPCSVSAG